MFGFCMSGGGSGLGLIGGAGCTNGFSCGGGAGCCAIKGLGFGCPALGLGDGLSGTGGFCG
jgi:hypothetical protein